MSAPHSVLDVAEYILQRKPGVSTPKLQNLCYYAQAWSLVWDGEPLFGEEVHASVGGPAIVELGERRYGEPFASVGGQPESLRPEAKETVDAVIEAYGDAVGEFLSEYAHSASPWRRARSRAGLKFGQRGNPGIALSDMREYYGLLYERCAG